MQILMTDLINFDPFTRVALWDLARKYGLSLPEYCTRDFHREGLRMHALKLDLKAGDRRPPTSLLDVELEHLERHLPGYFAFLDSCAKGELDLDFINLKYLSFIENNLVEQGFRASTNRWKPTPAYVSSFDTLEQLICFHGLIKPFLENKGEIFSRVRHCQECRRFFIFEKSTAKFCKTACRASFHRRQNKLK